MLVIDQNASWDHNNEQIRLLLENILKLIATIQSVESSERFRRLDRILISFPNLIETLFGSLMIEIEDNCLQIKQFMSASLSASAIRS
jgi:hypothetical protein